MPANTVYVGRPTKWGNPFTHAKASVLTQSYKKYITGFGDYTSAPKPLDRTEEIKRELNGKNLACLCKLNQPCHASVLLKIANSLTLSP